MHLFKTTYRLSLLAVALLCGPALMAQHEIGVFAGGSNFYGDVGKSNFYMPNKFVGGILYRHNYNHHFSLRVSVNHGEITAADSTSNLDENVRRNLEFWSEVWEASIWLEFNFFPYKIGDPKLHSFFVFAGLSGLHFNPKGYYDNSYYVELQPLSTEGQGTSLNPNSEPYLLYTMAIPFGFGYKFNIGRYIGVGAEVGFRKTYSDYLDDVSTVYVDPQALADEVSTIAGEMSDRSKTGLDYTGYQRGNSQNKDWYIFSGITITFKIFDVPEKCHDFSF
jgi:hypothetical protein